MPYIKDANNFVLRIKLVLKNNYFEITGKVKQLILCAIIETKFAPIYACIFVYEIETKFLETQKSKSSLWFRHIYGVFFIWTHEKEKLQKFLNNLNNHHPNVKLIKKAFLF